MNDFIVYSDKKFFIVPKTKFNLFDAFINLKKVTIHNSQRQAFTGCIQSIQLEDGTGSSFNLVINDSAVYFRTID